MAGVDRRLIAIVATGALVVVAILVIVFVAIIPIPEYSPLQRGLQSGYVAYQVGDDGEPEAIEIVNLESLTRVRVDIGRDIHLVGWHTDGQLVVHDWRTDDRYVLVDPATGDETEEVHPGQFDPLLEQDQAYHHHEDGKVVFEHPDRAESARFTAPRTYDIRSSVALDDQIVFIDELGRVAITDLGDDVNPLLIATGASEWAEVAARR